MKNYLATALALLFFLSSCKKDLEHHLNTSAEESEGLTTLSNPGSINNGVVASGWKGSTDWNRIELPTHTVYSTNIRSEILNKPSQHAVTRVFAKSHPQDEFPRSLPYEETIGDQVYYWYYFVTKGNLTVAVDAYGASAKKPPAKLLQVVVFNRDAHPAQDENGEVKKELMKLSYDQVSDLIKH